MTLPSLLPHHVIGHPNWYCLLLGGSPLLLFFLDLKVTEDVCNVFYGRTNFTFSCFQLGHSNSYLREDDCTLTYVASIPACSMPRVGNHQINCWGNLLSKNMICYKVWNKPAVSLVLTLKIGRPHVVPGIWRVLFMWQTFSHNLDCRR